MYIHQEKKRKTSLLWVLILTILILTGLWFIKNQPEWAKPFEPTPTPTLEAQYYINDGEINFAEGRLHQAIKTYQKAIQLEPDNDIPYARESKLLIYTGDTAAALTKAEQAVLLNPGSVQNLAEYCRALDWEGLYGQAADACECAIELAPTYAPAHAYLSEVYADQASWISARTTAQEALDIDFQSPEAHHNMGYALEVQGRYAEAVEYYENAITLRPNLAFYYIAAGRNYYWLGNLDKAADRFGEAIKLDPGSPAGYDQLGWTYHTNGEDSRAVDALEQAIGVDPAYAKAWGHLGAIYYLRQNYEKAIDTLPTAIELAERQLLPKARHIQIRTQIEGSSGSELIPVLEGRFEQSLDGQSDILKANISPVQWVQDNRPEESDFTCGHLIAQKIKSQIVHASPTQDISFSQAFSQSTGTATLNLTTGELTLELENVPRPEAIPYQALIHYRPDKTESLGYIQPDEAGQIAENFSITTKTSAPLEYYYELGLSYAYLSPDFCAEAVPWLLKALEKEPAYYNPAWEGLKICPSDASPPTPLPTFTPTPTETSGG